jgi:hypothetical protein
MPSSRRRGRWAALAVSAVALLASGGPSVPSPAGTPADPDLDARYATPEGLPVASARRDEADPALAVLYERDKDEERHARAQVGDRHLPFLAAPRPGTIEAPTLVVPDRGSPWDLAEVAALVPAALSWHDDGLILRNTLLVTEGAELVVDSATVPTLLLASGPLGYVTIRATYSSLRFHGHPDAPLTVSSYDPTTRRRDDARHDGRAYVLARGSDMDIRHATLSDLGFATTGHTSGVGWKGAEGRPATGGASDSTFQRNYFGAYTAEAQGLVIARSAFLDNVIYGFDPHSNTDGTLVTDSVAARNGRHGFIFSQSCDGNVIRDSEAYLNGGTGFMIDDGIPPHGHGRTSDDNTLLRVSSHDNGDVGIVVEGGTGNRVEQAVVTNNEDGIWVRDGAAGTDLVGNRIVATHRTAVRLDAGLGSTVVADTEIVGARTGTHSGGGSITWLRGTRTRGTTSAGVRLDGDQSGARFADVQVLGSTGSALDVRGTALPAAARAAVDTGPGAPFWATWTLASALHSSILGLWAAILVLPLSSRLLVRSRRLLPHGT